MLHPFICSLLRIRLQYNMKEQMEEIMASNGWLSRGSRCVVIFLVIALVVDCVYAEERDDEWELFIRDPVEVGHVQTIEVPSSDGDSAPRILTLKTLATKPPLFEISNLLSKAECDHLIKLAEQRGLKASSTVSMEFDEKYGVYEADGVTLAYNVAKWKKKFKMYDFDGDGYLDNDEAHDCIPGLKGTNRNLTPDQVQRLFLDLSLDADSNRVLDLKEFWVMHERRDLAPEVKAWLAKLDAGELEAVGQKKRRKRISDQAWISWFKSGDRLLRDLPNRLTALTEIDGDIINTSESLQVVRYYPGGHYNAHYDSNDVDPGKDCIHTKMVLENVTHNHPKGRMCRFITIMYYLSDVEQGGETAFPLADNETYNLEEYKERSDTLTDLSNHCYAANKFVRPKKGKAVMWYNHDLDPETGWLGSKHIYSLHGGCDVKKGIKWIANSWITVDNIRSRQLEFQERHFQPAKESQATNHGVFLGICVIVLLFLCSFPRLLHKIAPIFIQSPSASLLNALVPPRDSRDAHDTNDAPGPNPEAQETKKSQ